MHIRKIRIDRFGCWEDLVIPKLEASLSVIHLDDGGRPCDFAGFLSGMLFGFKNDERNVEGSLDLGNSPPYVALKRHVLPDGRSGWDLSQDGKPVAAPEASLHSIQGEVNPVLARRLLSSMDSMAERWSWLGRNPDVADWLLAPNRPPHPALESISRVSVSGHGRVIEELAAQRDRLLKEIARRQAQDPQDSPEHTKQLPREVVIAELSDELRVLQRKLAPLQTAHENAEKWQELRRLDGLQSRAADVEKLRSLLHEYCQLNDQARDCEQQLQRALARPRTRKSAESTDYEFEIRRLLDREDWVRKVAGMPVSKGLTENRSRNIGGDQGIRRAAEWLQTAELARVECQQRLADFAAVHGIDLANLHANGEAKFDAPSELSEDDPIAQEPPERKIAELERRRRWVAGERAWLVRRQQLSSNLLLAIALLFSLSIASLFGVFLVATPLYQWVLTALGLSGMVASGAVKLSYERKMARLLGRVSNRLQRIDREILGLSDKLSGQNQATAQRRAGLKARAARLQRDVANAQSQVENADVAFREQLAAAGLPINLSPGDAYKLIGENANRTGESGERRSNPTDRKLQRWVKQARSVLKKLESNPPSENPMELLSLLEASYQRLRGQSRKATRKPRGSDRDEIRRARRELKQFEARQHEILRLAEVEDDYALVTELQAAERAEEAIRRVKSLREELKVTIASHQDGEEVRELLEKFSVNDLAARYATAMQQKNELQAELQRQQDIRPSKQLRKLTDAERAVEHLRLQLGVIGTRLRHAIKTSQVGMVLRRVAIETLDRNRQQSAGLTYLRELTNWDSLAFAGGQFVLSNADSRVTVEANSRDSRLAWLALQLEAATKLYRTGRAFPLVLLADELPLGDSGVRVFEVLRDLGDTDQQILLLTGKPLVARQLLEMGATIIRVGLREEPAAVAFKAKAPFEPKTPFLRSAA